MCPELCNNGKKVLGYGTFEEDRIMIVGEAPGREEAESGTPFIGKAGQLLRKLIKEAGMNWNHIYITNVVKCRPPDNRDPENLEISNCRKYLAAQVMGLSPSLIIAVGRIAMYALIDTKEKITKMAGTFNVIKGNSHPLHVYDYDNWIKDNVFIEHRGIVSVVMPMLHPSYIDRCGGENSDEYKKTLEKLKIIWEDYEKKIGWYMLSDDLPF